MPYLLYSGRTRPTGDQLRGLLQIPGGTQAPPDQVDVLIRWGNSANIARRPGRVLNRRDAILRATDKFGALRLLHEQHVSVPPFFDGNTQFMPYPVLGRRNHHTQGRDIVLCLQQLDAARAVAAGCTHFTAYIPTAREFRVHVFENEVLKVSEKVLTDETNYVPWVRNFEHGYTFRNLRPIAEVVLSNVTTTARAAVQALGLTFGAADVILGDNGQSYVLEVNTGPSLGDNSLGAYARKFASVLGLQVEIPETADEANIEEGEDE